MNDPKKTCFCFTCNKHFEPGGVAGHRAAHRNHKQYCRIRFTHGNIEIYDYREKEVKSGKSK